MLGKYQPVPNVAIYVAAVLPVIKPVLNAPSSVRFAFTNVAVVCQEPVLSVRATIRPCSKPSLPLYR